MEALSCLRQYLNHHFSGSTMGKELISILARSSATSSDRAFFETLGESVDEERKILDRLMADLGESKGKVSELVENLTAKSGLLKFRWEGMDEGNLGHFEALEMLLLGIEGKRSLWIMLAEISPFIPEWTDWDFTALAAKAHAQRLKLEERWLAAGRCSLLLNNHPLYP